MKGNSYLKILPTVGWLNDLPFVEGRAVEWQARTEPLTGRMVLIIKYIEMSFMKVNIG